jgi:hypothetical protein
VERARAWLASYEGRRIVRVWRVKVNRTLTRKPVVIDRVRAAGLKKQQKSV